jgi:biopolymer transport protein ExbB
MKWLALLLALLTLPVEAAPGLDQLLQRVLREADSLRQEAQEREQAFLRQRDRRKALLEEARAALARERERLQALTRDFEGNEQRLRQQTALLKERTAGLQELFDTVRQAARDVHGLLDGSLLSAQHPEWARELEGLMDHRRQPGMEEIKALWHQILRQMAAGGEVARFEAPVIAAGGGEEPREVVRIGEFTAVSGTRFLRYLPETGRLVEPLQQPGSRLRSMAGAWLASGGPPRPMAVDPSRGAVLGLMGRAPGLREQVEEAGVIAWMILAVGGFGLLLVVERLVTLSLTGRRVRRQLDEPDRPGDNPLGRILAVHGECGRIDVEGLQHRLNEAILRELPRIRRGLPMLALLAAVAPLLGLLGTVTGMIQTFQSITLFGTGDPRLMSGGISQALVTTELGLAVAIVLVLLHGFLNGRSNWIIQVLDEQSAGLVAARAEGHVASR